jgi:hypothetical protein
MASQKYLVKKNYSKGKDRVQEKRTTVLGTFKNLPTGLVNLNHRKILSSP